jgi:hypothetical protein
MQALPTSSHRIWPRAAIVAVTLVLTPILIAVIEWELGVDRDPDMTGVHELILFLFAVLAMPSALLSFGVMAPSAIVLDRLVRGRTSRVTNLTLGVAVGVLALVVMILGTAVVSWQPGPSIVEMLVRFVSKAANRPKETFLAVAYFCLMGMFVTLGMRHRTN